MTAPEPCAYRLHGLRLRSELPLAGLEMEAGGHDVDIRWGQTQPVPAEAPPGRLLVAFGDGGGYLYVGTVDGAALTLRAPGLCDFVIGGGLRTVECRRDPAADPAFVAVVVAGLVVSFLLNMAGDAVLHASAVEVDGRAVAFAGVSGSGKSTIAALLCGAGARLVTDDVLRLGEADGPACVGGAPQIRLRSGAEWALGHFADPPATTPTVDHRLAVRPGATRELTVPLSTVVLPRLRREATSVELRTLSRTDAVWRLMSLSRVVGWRDPGVLARQFHAMGRLTAEVPVVEAVVPWGPASRSSVVGALAELAARPGTRH